MRKITIIKASSKVVSRGIPTKPREPPKTSENLSELSRRTLTRVPKPRVAMARKSSRSLRIGMPIK